MREKCPELAVLVPAYRAMFLAETLRSFRDQTRQVPVFVFDDASPDDLRGVCEDFEPELDIRYHRFQNNLGGRDLASHWNRCVEMCQAEWIWLFSDDDTADPDCVERLLDAIARSPKEDVLSFDSRTIDGDGGISKTHPPLPVHETAAEFLLGRLRGSRESFMPDHAFRRKRWQEVGGVPSFPLAWHADDAFWLEMSRESGLLSVGAAISWRRSGSNLSSIQPALARRKYEALCQYDRWLASGGWFRKLADEALVEPGGVAALRREWFWLSFRALGTAFSPATWSDLHASMDRRFPQSRLGRFVSFFRVWLHRILHSAR